MGRGIFMFIYSMRAGTLRFFAVVCVALAVLVALIAFVPELQPVAAAAPLDGETEHVRYDKIKNNADRVSFLAQWGWQVEEEPVETVTVTIPQDFDKVFAAYNELQKAQGLDLSAYSGKNAERITYKITNYEGYDGTVYANLFVFRHRVIGGDVSAAEKDGFVRGFAG